jgi:DNA replication regulator SLD3
MFLSRKRVPFAYLDLSDPYGDLPKSRLFECRVKILDLEDRMATTPGVVIARSEPKGTLHVIEKQSAGLYVICKLGAWVDVAELGRHASVVAQDLLQASKLQSKVSPPAVDLAPVPRPSHVESKKKRAAIEAIQSLVRKRPRSATAASADVDAEPEQTPLPGSDTQEATPSLLNTPVLSNIEVSVPIKLVDADTLVLNGKEAVFAQPTAESLCETLRTHYFETLYKSMVSTAALSEIQVANVSRDRWRSLPRGLYREHGRHFTWTWIVT